MREPFTKFPKRATGLVQTRSAISECQAMLAKRSLSPELREGLKLRLQQLEEELKAATAHAR